MTLVCTTWRLAPQTGTMADTFCPVSHLMPSLVFVSFVAPSAPRYPVSQPQEKIQWWVLLGREPLLHKPSLSHQGSTLPKSELAGTSKHCWWDQVAVLSCCGASESSCFHEDWEASCLVAQPLHKAAHPIQFLEWWILLHACRSKVWHFKQTVLSWMYETVPSVMYGLQGGEQPHSPWWVVIESPQDNGARGKRANIR